MAGAATAGTTTSGSDNVYVGALAGFGTTGANNVILGSHSATGANALNNAVLIGTDTTGVLLSTAVGDTATVTAARGVAIGSGSIADTVIGTSSGTIDGITYTYAGGSPISTVSIGSAGAERTVTNVAAGRISSSSSDAVNGSQLFAAYQGIEALSQDALLWDPALGAFSASHGGVTVNKITNVAAGAVSATSVDAINGSQLFATNQTAATNAANTSTYLGGGAGIATGVAPSYTVQGATYNNVGSALGAVDTNLTNITSQIGGLQNDALLWDSALGAFSASHGGVTVNKITNVAAGDVSATSTDAVNGSQLFGVQTQVDQNTTDIANIDTRVTTVEGT